MYIYSDSLDFKNTYINVPRHCIYSTYLLLLLSASIVNSILHNKCVTKQGHISLIVDFSMSIKYLSIIPRLDQLYYFLSRPTVP